MKCKDPDTVADVPYFTKETFGVRCGNLKDTPTFETPPPHLWPRCIPKVCIKYLNGTLWNKESKASLQVYACNDTNMFLITKEYTINAEKEENYHSTFRNSLNLSTFFQKTLGTCNCEFNECAEYIFDRLEDQCPNGNDGPTCALESYVDTSEDIEDLFDGNAPPDAPISTDITDCQDLLDKLVEAKYKAAEILTGASENRTTLAPISTPKYGSSGMLFC